jgi:hypothetical protein
MPASTGVSRFEQPASPKATQAKAVANESREEADRRKRMSHETTPRPGGKNLF